MKTTIGGDRLGSGNKQNVSLRNYERSTHDLGYTWRSSMAPGTLVPFLKNVALPGDSFDIDLDVDVLTLPTIGPLFGSFKVQLDVFMIPFRLYNASLHMNRTGIGMDMSQIFLPKWNLNYNPKGVSEADRVKNDAQINPSSLASYLGIKGLGWPSGIDGLYFRQFNAIPLLAYWDIYKNYYANKQEERGMGIHIDQSTLNARQAILEANLYKGVTLLGDILNNATATGTGTDDWAIVFQFGPEAQQMNPDEIILEVDAGTEPVNTRMTSYSWNDTDKTLTVGGNFNIGTSESWEILDQEPEPINPITDYTPSIVEFPLSNIDDMREDILQKDKASAFLISTSTQAPYGWSSKLVVSNTEIANYACQYSQESLALKTYQSDLFNNWIETEWIDGVNGVNAVTAIDTSGGSFDIDTLNLSKKVYDMLNRIAISGGTYQDWLEAVYAHKGARMVDSPMYMGSLIKELAFQEVISTADTNVGSEQPLGTLAGRGRLTNKHKGGKIRIKTDEPSYIMGIVSITPRIDYSQGNEWDTNLFTMDDLHKPALDAIGFQDLITEQMAWQASSLPLSASTPTMTSAGKVPAWINYMTAVNKTFGNFADENKEMFMTLNRRYDIDPTDGSIADLTTYIDPSKYNHIFAQTNLDAMNFWVQIGVDIMARRKMSAKVIPNL